MLDLLYDHWPHSSFWFIGTGLLLCRGVSMHVDIQNVVSFHNLDVATFDKQEDRPFNTKSA